MKMMSEFTDPSVTLRLLYHTNEDDVRIYTPFDVYFSDRDPHDSQIGQNRIVHI